MSRELINSEKFPSKPHNNPASRVPGLIFCAGQTATGEIKQATVRYSQSHKIQSCLCAWQQYSDFLLKAIPGIRNFTNNKQRTALQNLKEVLELAGSSVEKIVKINVYLASMEDFAAMNEAYIEFLPQPMPPRSCLQALAPGKGTVIEIECIAQA